MDTLNLSEHHFHAEKHNIATKQNQINSPLLRLPPELRNRIYAYAFSSATLKRDSMIIATAAYPDGYRTSTRFYTVRDGVVLRRVCRQMRFEIRPFQRNSSSTRFYIACNRKWFLGSECSKIKDMEMSYQVAEALHEMLRHETNCGWYPDLREIIGRGTFSNLRRLAVTCSESDLEGSVKVELVGRSLLSLLQKSAPEVYIKSAGAQILYHGMWWRR
ncbi:hypothetical protein G6514_000964 [Epicoccum nigrum]|nr:hypothetical protein G6514_000964 [Epicoccum nigrum]